MAVKNFKPTSPARRYYSVSDFKEITRDAKPLKKLTDHQTSTGGRNHYGRITSRFRGGGHKQRYRIIDWKRDKVGVPAVVATVEYDPNRTARIALLHYADGEKRYILAPDGLRVGDKIVSSRNADIKPGNSMSLRHLPLGTMIHNIELKKGRADNSCAPPEEPLPSWRRTGITRRSDCPPAKCEWCTSIAMPRSAKSRIWSMPTFRSAKRVAHAGSDAGRTIGA